MNLTKFISAEISPVESKIRKIMPKLTTGNLAIDFELKDTSDNSVRLSSYRGRKRIVLVLMRGFY